MGVRQSINENKRLGVGVGAAILIVGVSIISYQLFGNSVAGAAAKQAYYTDDNGKTFFADDILKVSPFDHGGKQAYRADVFKCPDGKQVVGLIYRHTSTGRHELESYISNKLADKDRDGSMLHGIELRSMEVKRPAPEYKSWNVLDETTLETLRASVKCPGGGTAELVVP